MPDGNSTALLTGLLVLAVVSVATLTFVGRSRLRKKYLSSSESRNEFGSPSPPAGVVSVPDTGSRATGSGADGPASSREEEAKDPEEEELPALLTASPPCWQNPLVLGFNKLKPRTTLGAFSSAHSARCDDFNACFGDGPGGLNANHRAITVEDAAWGLLLFPAHLTPTPLLPIVSPERGESYHALKEIVSPPSVQTLRAPDKE